MGREGTAQFGLSNPYKGLYFHCCVQKVLQITQPDKREVKVEIKQRDHYMSQHLCKYFILHLLLIALLVRCQTAFHCICYMCENKIESNLTGKMSDRIRYTYKS